MAEAKQSPPPEHVMDHQRQIGEPVSWYARFQLYLMLGAQRTQIGAYNQERAQRGLKPCKALPEGWRNIIKRWNWQQRAESFDIAQQTKALSDFQLAQVEIQKKALGLSMQMMGKAETMLNFPLMQTTLPNGVVINPPEWNFETAAALASGGVSLANNAIYGPKSGVTVNVNDEREEKTVVVPRSSEDMLWLKEVLNEKVDKPPVSAVPGSTGTPHPGDGTVPAVP